MVTTVTTVTTVTAIAALGLTSGAGAVVIVTLIAFLASREVASAANSNLSLRIARFASVGTLPLAMAFTAIVVVRIISFF